MPWESAPASASRSGRQASRVRSAHSARPTARATTGPAEEVGSPVASAMFSSATRASSSSRMRQSGSTLVSASPSVAIQRATWRAMSQFTGPALANSFATSPKSPAKGLGSGSFTEAW